MCVVSTSKRARSGRSALVPSSGLAAEIGDGAAERQLVADRDLEHAEMKAAIRSRRCAIGQVGMVDDHIAIGDQLAAPRTSIEPPWPAHLQPKTKTVAGDARNIGFGAANGVGGSRYLRDNRRAEFFGTKGPRKGGAPVCRQFDRDAEKVPAADLAPLLEAVPGGHVIGRKTQHSLGPSPPWPAWNWI